MPVIINQLSAEITEPAEIQPEVIVNAGSGNIDLAQNLSEKMELITERAERLQVD